MNAGYLSLLLLAHFYGGGAILSKNDIPYSNWPIEKPPRHFGTIFGDALRWNAEEANARNARRRFIGIKNRMVGNAGVEAYDWKASTFNALGRFALDVVTDNCKPIGLIFFHAGHECGHGGFSERRVGRFSEAGTNGRREIRNDTDPDRLRGSFSIVLDSSFDCNRYPAWASMNPLQFDFNGNPCTKIRARNRSGKRHRFFARGCGPACFVSASFRMSGGLFSIPRSEGGCHQSKSAYDGSNQAKPERTARPVRGFLSSISRFPLSAKIAATVVATLLAGCLWIYGLVSALEFRVNLSRSLACCLIGSLIVSLSGLLWW